MTAPFARSFADWAAGLESGGIPAGVRETARRALVDFAGLCLAARGSGYLESVLAAWEGAGDCTALGQARGLDAAGAAMVNGTAAHGEDYDDTFEGTPVHTGAVVLPASPSFYSAPRDRTALLDTVTARILDQLENADRHLGERDDLGDLRERFGDDLRLGRRDSS